MLGAIAAAAIQVGPEMLPAIQRAKLAGEILASAPETALPVPVIGVRRQRLRDSWGAPRSQGRQHQGIDIVAPRGRPVVSTTRGIVRSVGTNRLGGQVVWVTGPGGQAHYYAHLDRYGSVRAGDIVQPGTVLGYVGDTGNAKGTTPHLHYGIYEPGAGPINPYPLLAAPAEEPLPTSATPARLRLPDNGRISVRPRAPAGQ